MCADVLDFKKPDKQWKINLIKNGKALTVIVPEGYDDLLCLPKDAPYHFLARSGEDYIGFCRQKEKWENAAPFLRTMRAAFSEGLV